MRYTRAFLLLFVIILTLTAVQNRITNAATSQLATVAASMQPGTWATLSTVNLNATLGPTYGGSSRNAIAEGPKMMWDPVTQKVLFFGSDHCDIAIFAAYDAASNTWSRLPRASWMPSQSAYCNGMMHGEDLAGLDPARGNYYYREFFLNNQKVHRYNTTTQTWTNLPLFGAGDYIESSIGVDFFPEINSLVMVNGGGGVPKYNNIYLYSEDTQQWTTINVGQSGSADSYRNFARYNPVHKVVVFTVTGFGDRRMFKLDAQKRVTRLRDAPIGTGIMCPCDSPATIFLADPVTGDYIVLSKDTKQMWKYDVVSDTWTPLSISIPAGVLTSTYGTNVIFSVSVATISTYGVHMFTACDANNCRVNLFKYAASAAPGDTTPPTVSVTAPANNATVSGVVSVTANAADNTGVAGVQFTVDGANVGAEDTTSPYSVSWDTASAVAGAHTIAAVARDAAGNRTTASIAVNKAAAPGFDFSLSNSGSVSVTQGQAATRTMTATIVSGTTQAVSFAASGQPAGTTAGFSAASCSPTCSSTLTLTTSASTPAGTFPVTVTATGGSVSRTTSFNLTVTGSTGGLTYDFANLCAQPGVLKCVGFENLSQITGTYGDNSGSFSGAATPQIDSSIKSSGVGSLKFTIPPNSPANSSGSYFTNFSSDLQTQFGANSEFYVQWRQRFSPEFISTVYAGGGGWKQAIIGTGDKPGCTASTSSNGLCYSSCTDLETVTQNTFTRGFPQMYNSCSGSTSHGAYDPFTESFGQYDYKMQNARPAPYCLYSQGQTNPPSYFPPQGNCFGYFANEWMTFQVHIKTGPRVNDEFTNSYVQLWVAREGQPGELVLNWGPYNLTAGNATTDQKYGKVWLLPYNTGKNSAVTYPVAYTWYDDLIISTQPISIGGSGGGGDTVAPAVSVSSPTAGSTVSGTVTVSATASDNVGVAGVQFQVDGVNLGAEDTTAPYSVSWSTASAANGAHTLAAIARDAAGNRTTSSAVSVTVSNSTSDTTPPTVSITAPAAGATVAGTITVSANAADNVGVVGVQFRIDGTTLGAEDTTAPFSVSWNTTGATNGGHTLLAVARDAAGNRTNSASISVTVSNDAIAPVISAVASSNVTATGATITWTTNEASDSQVEYGPTTSYGTQTAVNATAVTSHSQALSGLTPGTTYNYRVKSKDASGNLSVSGNFTFATPSSGSRTVDVFPGTNTFSAAAQSLAAGDTLIVHQGTYNETNRMSIQVQGSASAPITIKGADGETRPIITRPASASLQNTFNIEGSAKYLTIRGLEIIGNGGDGVNMSGPVSFITLEDLVIHDIDVGINFRASMNNITVRRNHIYNTGINSGTGEGLYVGCNNASCAVRDSLIEQNWIHDSLPGTTQGDGIEVKVGSYGNIIRDNVVYNRAYPGIFVYGTGSNPVNLVEGNVVWNSLEGIYAVADAIVRNNIVFNSGTGLSLYGHAQVSQMKNVTAVNNTLYNNNDGIYMRWGSTAVNMILANNAVYSPGKTALNLSGSVGTFVSNYVEGGSDRSLNTTQFINGGTSANAFVNPGGMDFWPKAGSILIGKANNIHAPVADFNGTTRVSPQDVGAYESDGLTANPGWKITAGFKNSSGSTPGDTTAPAISGVAASGVTTSGATIQWVTDEASNSQVEYGVSASYGSQTAVNTSMVTSHSQTLSGLLPGTLYNYRVKSRDAAGNLGVSGNLTFTTASTPPSVETGLTAKWKFDEGAGTTTVDSVGTNNGTLVNSPVWTTGVVGKALQFNALDNFNDNDDPQVLIGRNFDIPALPFTFAAWVNPAGFTDWRAILSKRDRSLASSMRLDIGLSKNTGKVYVATGGRNMLTFNAAPSVNTWTHIAIVATATDTKLYVNGVLSQTMGAVTLGSSATANTVIGGTGEGAGGDNDPFKGIIDEIRVYNRALTAQEVQTVYGLR